MHKRFYAQSPHLALVANVLLSCSQDDSRVYQFMPKRHFENHFHNGHLPVQRYV